MTIKLEVYRRPDPRELSPTVDTANPQFTVPLDIRGRDHPVIVPIDIIDIGAGSIPHAQKIDHPGESRNGVDALAVVETPTKVVLKDRITGEKLKILHDGKFEKVDVYRRNGTHGQVQKAAFISDMSLAQRPQIKIAGQWFPMSKP